MGMGSAPDLEDLSRAELKALVAQLQGGMPRLPRLTVAKQGTYNARSSAWLASPRVPAVLATVARQELARSGGIETAKRVTYRPPSASGSLRASSRTMLAACWAKTCDRRATSPSWSPPLIVIRCVTLPVSSGLGSNIYGTTRT